MYSALYIHELFTDKGCSALHMGSNVLFKNNRLGWIDHDDKPVPMWTTTSETLYHFMYTNIVCVCVCVCVWSYILSVILQLAQYCIYDFKSQGGSNWVWSMYRGTVLFLCCCLLRFINRSSNIAGCF